MRLTGSGEGYEADLIRCRRMRTKCVHDETISSCRACNMAGIDPKECVYPMRGEPDDDRNYRHPRARAIKNKCSDRSQLANGSGIARRFTTYAEVGHLCELPPTEELVEAVSRFCSRSFQLSFILKDDLCSRLHDNPQSINSFLLTCILAVSARLSPLSVERYNGGAKASLVYLERASAMSLDEIRQGPSLERCQALCLLSIAEHRQGHEKQSYITLGIAIRMASWLQLHNEETFQIDNPTPQTIRTAESARRTLWMLFCHEKMISGGRSIVTLSLPNITTLLPCSESNFTQGQGDPCSQAALTDTPPMNEDSVSNQGPSLFASLIQILDFWATIKRRLAEYLQCSGQGGDSDHRVGDIKQRLKDWEYGLPEHHTWSLLMLQKHRTNGHDLAYLRVTMMLRLCNIAIRQPCVEEIIYIDPATAHQEPYILTSFELYNEVQILFLQISSLFSDKSTSEGGDDPIFGLCVYTCGLLSLYLCKYPSICQNRSIVDQGPKMLTKILSILEERIDIWPQAARWKDELSIHVPLVAMPQGSPIGEMLSSRHYYSSYLVLVSSQDSLRHLPRGRPYLQPSNLSQSLAPDQGPQQTMNGQDFYPTDQTNNRILDNPHSQYPPTSTKPVYNISLTGTEIMIFGSQGALLDHCHSGVTASKDMSLGSGLPIQPEYSHTKAHQPTCEPHMDGITL